MVVRLVSGGNGFIYAIQSDGVLLLYRHVDYANGGPTWINNGTGRQIGTDWQQFQHVLADDDGQLFGFRADGTVLWYKYVVSDWNTGAGNWAARSGSVIGTGFQIYPRVFGGWDGQIYGIDAAGNLFFYRYTAGDGSSGPGAWLRSGVGAQVGSGWQAVIRVWASDVGVVFGVRQGGTLHWWRYLAGDGTAGASAWANGGIDVQVGTGWGDDTQREWFSTGFGTIYTVRLDTSTTPGIDGTLAWYRLDNYLTVAADGGPRWINGGSGVVVGGGFTVERSGALQGYANDLSVLPGDTLAFPVSSTFPSYAASVVRLAPASGDPVTVANAGTHTGRLQVLPSGYRANGCGWSPGVTVGIPAGWASGVYALRLAGPHGLLYDIPFVVRPTAPAADIAFLLPTNTYNAYNYWGGHNQYTDGQDGVQRTVTFLRPSTSVPVAPNGTISHTLISDLFLLRWMTGQAIAFDCYHDGDLHGDSSWLASYKALVLASHPEYWTDQMRAAVVSYLDNGGRLIYTGGNGIYERVEFTDDGNALIFRDSSGNRNFYDNQSDILGVATAGDGEYMVFRPYVVKRHHDFFAGTGLIPGTTFGATGYNYAAAGWEVDQAPDPSGVIATGFGSGKSANMSVVNRDNGGWVFSAGSIAFNGALPYDSRLSALLRNVFNAAVA